MHRFFVQTIKEYRQAGTLAAVVANGDMTDMAAISRWPKVDFPKFPSPKEEEEVCQERMGEIEDAAGRSRKLWPLGNHDARWSIYLATHAPEFARDPPKGFSLKDHFPLWEPCWSVMVNYGTEGATIIKHIPPAGGSRTSRRLSIERSGIHVVGGHLHNANLEMYNDYRPWTLYSVDAGCLAEPYGPQFLYLQDAPRNWRSAFAVLTYKDGKLMVPELAVQWDRHHIQFRGKIIKV